MQHIGEELKLRRLLAGVLQRDVARMAGISQPKLSNIERGYKIPTEEIAMKIRGAIEELSARGGEK